MSQGSWVRGLFGALLVCAATLTLKANAGFEVGNGTSPEKFFSSANSLLETFSEVDPGETGFFTELLAPASDGTSPRTRLVVQILPLLSSAEEALKGFLAANKGWHGFAYDEAAGFHRERQLRKNLNRLDVQLFGEKARYIIQLEGNKSQSQAYLRLSKSLLSECEQE